MFLRNNRELAEQIRRVMTSTSHVNDSFHAMNTLMQSIQSGQNVRHSFDGGATDSTGNLNDPSESNTHASSPYLLSSYSKLTRTDLAAGSVQPVVPIFQQINSSMSSGKMSDIQQLLGYNILNAQDKQKLSSLISSTLTRQLSEDHGTKSKSNSIMHNAGKNYSSTYRKNGDAVQPAEQFLETLDEDSIQRSSYLNEGGDLYNNGQSKTKRSRKKESNTDEPAKKTNLQTDQEKFSRKRKSNEILVSEKNKDNKRSKTKKVTAVERITAVESTVSRSSRKSKLVNTVIVEGKKDKKTGDDDIQAILDESYIEDDLLDLRNPVDCRIYLDFTTKDMLPVPSTKDVSSDNYDASQDLWPSQYAYGIYHGKLTHGKRDVNINYLKQLKSLALISPAMHDSFSDNGSDNVPISPKSSKVGEDYQAVIPSLVAKPTDNGRPLRSNVSYIDSEILWKPGKITEKDLQAYLMNVTNLKLSQVISVGSILVACIPQCSSSKKYRLCAVTAIQNDENPGSLFDLKGNISSKVNIVVHDGIEVGCFYMYLLLQSTLMLQYFQLLFLQKWSIPPSACAPFKQWHELKSLQFIYKNNYRIPSVNILFVMVLRLFLVSYYNDDLVVQQNAELLLIDINEFESAQNLKNWSSQDVKIFCDATRR